MMDIWQMNDLDMLDGFLYLANPSGKAGFAGIILIPAVRCEDVSVIKLFKVGCIYPSCGYDRATNSLKITHSYFSLG